MKCVLKFLLSLPFALTLGAVSFYALGGFVIAPWWLKRELPQLLQEHLSATGSVGEIAINPFQLTLDVRDFAATEAGGTTPAIAFHRLFIDFEASSLFKRAWTFANVTLEQPRAYLELDAQGKLNWLKLVPKQAAPKPAHAPSALPRLLLEKLVILQGAVAFSDKSLPVPATANLVPLEFELDDLSTLPDQQGEYRLTARLPAGGTVGWRGTISLTPIASSGRLEIKALKLATLWRFVQDKLLIEEPGGSATLTLNYNVGHANNRTDASVRDIALQLVDMAVRQKGVADPALTAGELALTGGTFNLGERNVRFSNLTLAKMSANTRIDANGNANWTRLIAPIQASAAPMAPTRPAAGAHWQIAIDAVNLKEVRLNVIDEGFAQPLALDVARTDVQAGVKMTVGPQTTAIVDGIAVEMKDIRVAEAGATNNLVTMAALTLSDGKFDLAQQQFFAESVKLAHPVAAIARDAKGAINLAAAFARKARKPADPSSFVAEIATVELADGTVAFQDHGSGAPLALDFQNIRVLAKHISSDAKAVVPFEAALHIKQGGAVRAQGSASIGQQHAFIKLTARDIALMPLAALLQKHTTLKLASGSAYAAGDLEWKGQGNGAGIRYHGNAGLEHLRLAHAAGSTNTNTEGETQAKQAGSLKVQGTVTTNPQRASLKIEARDIALAPFNPFLAKQTTLALASGSVHAAGQLDWNGQSKAPGVRFTGSSGIDDLRLDHAGSGERLIAWKSLLGNGIKVNTADKNAQVEDVTLTAPAGRVAIAKDHSTNFADIMRASASELPSQAAGTPAAASAAPASDEAPFAISVERIHVKDGELDFSDQSLVLPFAAVIREFGGTVTGLSTQPGTRASLNLEGRVDEYGQANVSGAANIADPKAFTDISVKFRNVAMSPLTPYSATFAGRRIANGKLSLDLQYKLNNSELAGENKMLLEQFALGERVNSPSAIDLPLDLAIALLTDADGKIDLSVPVRGNVDKPEFAYGALIWQAIRTVITRIVTAPFRALGSLLGGNAEKMAAIGFEAGRAHLAPPEREKLAKVAGVLRQRPQLRLVIEGRFDEKLDGAALRAAAARDALAKRQDVKPAAAEEPAPVNFDNAKTQRAIEAMLEERAGPGAIDPFKASYEKTSGKPVSRVNTALALLGRGSPDRAFYEAMFKQVVALQPLDKSALSALAAQRSAAIAAYLKTSASLTDQRVGSKPPTAVGAGATSEINTALSLEVAK